MLDSRVILSNTHFRYSNKIKITKDMYLHFRMQYFSEFGNKNCVVNFVLTVFMLTDNIVAKPCSILTCVQDTCNCTVKLLYKVHTLLEHSLFSDYC